MSDLINTLKGELRGAQLALLEKAAVIAETDACSMTVSELLKSRKFTAKDLDKALEDVGAKLTQTLSDLSFILEQAKNCIAEANNG